MINQNIDRKIKYSISSNLEGINEQSRNYIKDIVRLINREIGINKILSIVLFGSQRAEEENTILSDCDLLFIFKDRVSNHHIKEIEKYFIALEIKHKFKDPSTKLTRNILGVIQQSTGMFMSHFLTKKKFWDQAIFHKIFQVNKLFSAIFAPRNIVLGNVILNSTILFGDDVRREIKPKIKISMREIVRSTVMNLFISLFGLLLSPRKELKSIKYSLESIKWSLKASNYYCFGDTQLLDKIIERFILFEKPIKKQKVNKFYDKFMSLRCSPSNDFKFMLMCPIYILKVHISAILYRKMIKRKVQAIPVKVEKPLIDQRTFPLRY